MPYMNALAFMYGTLCAVKIKYLNVSSQLLSKLTLVLFGAAQCCAGKNTTGLSNVMRGQRSKPKQKKYKIIMANATA